MLTEKMLERLNNLSTFGASWMFDEEEDRAGKFNYRKRLRDFTDNDVAIIISKYNPNSASKLMYYLAQSTNNQDSRARIYGFESYADMKRQIDELLEEEANDK